jgi:transglutaminase superfamily protein
VKNYPIFRVCWFVANTLLVVSCALLVFSGIWEFSTRSYLKGFSDAIIPSSDDPEKKVEAILTWMQHGPARRSTQDPNALDARDPENTLNYQQLLEVCGTATNAFVNLAQSSGLSARRILLLDQNLQSKHVVAEVFLNDRWVVVDPSYHTILRLPGGRMVSRQELANSAIFHAATSSIPGYLPVYTYDRTVHVRVSRIPFVGRHLRPILKFIWPSWEESINWTLLMERESFALLTTSILLLCFALAVRVFLGWYCSRKLGVHRVRLRDQLGRAGSVLLSNSK